MYRTGSPKCDPCRATQARERYRNQTAEARAHRRAYQRANYQDPSVKPRRLRQAKEAYQRLFKALLDMYGHACECCYEQNEQFLTLDHIQNDGYKERPNRVANSAGSWRRALKENDKTRYQILCYNCNCGRARNKGVCPHGS